MVREDENSEGIDNLTRSSKENVYEYRDTIPTRSRLITPKIAADFRLQERLAQNRKFSSTPSLRSNSNVSLKDMAIRGEGFVTSSPNGQARINKSSSQTTLPRAKTHLIQGVPQTAV